MSVPLEMSLLKISINRDDVPILLGNIPKFPYFQIREYEEVKKSRFHQRKEKTILKEQKEILEHKLNEIEENILFLFHTLDINPDEVPIPEPDKRISMEAENIQELIDKLHEYTENQSRRVKGYFNDLEKHTEDLEYYSNLKQILQWLEKYRVRKEVFSYFKQLKFRLFILTKEMINELESALDQEQISSLIQVEKLPKKKYAMFIIYLGAHQKEMNEILMSLKLDEITIDTLMEHLTEEGIDLSKIEEKIKFCNERIDKANQKIEEAKQNALLYRAYYEIYENIKNYMKLEDQFYSSLRNQYVKLEAFVPTKYEAEVSQMLIRKFGNRIRIDAIKIPRNMKEQDIEQISQELPQKETEDDEEETQETKMSHEELDAIYRDLKVPSLVVPKKIFKPFKLLVNLYGTTNYREIDPTPIVALTFPLIFGLMFGDVGHGLVLLAFGMFIAFHNRKKKDSTYDFGFFVMWLGVAAIFGGFMYGEFFGNELIINGKHIVLFANPLHDIVGVLKISIIIGIIHLTIAWIIAIVNSIMKKRVYEAFTDPFLKIVLLLGGTYLIFNFGFDIYSWIEPPYPILYVVIPGILLMIARPIGKVVFKIPYYQEESTGSLIGESIFEVGETYLNMLSNVASYSRILALSMAHLSLMMILVILTENNNLPDIVVILILIVGNLTVIAFESLLATIHTMRLHFYEFFGKFYTGDGIRYTPIQIKEDYSIVKFVKL